MPGNKTELDKLQENLAKDLVELEDRDSVEKAVLDKVTDVYSKVYDIITKIKSL